MKESIFERFIVWSIMFLSVALLMPGNAFAGHCAGGTPCVDSHDIIDGQVKTHDIKNNAVRGRHIKRNSITSRKVKDGSLTGADINPNTTLNVGEVATQGIKNIDGVVSTYNVTTKRYHISSRFATSGGRTIPLDMNIVAELCGDEDGCRVRAIMRKWDNDSRTEGASWVGNGYILTYMPDGHWRIADRSGVDGNSATQHIIQWWDCFLTDGNYASFLSLGDADIGIGLLNWNSSYKNPNKTCELTLED